MEVDVGAVLEAGRDVELHAEIPLPPFGAFTFPKPAVVDFGLRRFGRALAVAGAIDATYGGDCERCLGKVDRRLHLDVDEKIEASTAWQPVEHDPFSEASILTGTTLDVGDLVRQLVDAALPLINLCSDDCAGLCAQCGETLDGCECGPTTGGDDG